ncbi:alpha/beta-hydrolase, partial [Patellaria atrata CBS 101060]
IAPSTKLEWHECYNKFLCARLTVPMDYHRPLEASSDNPKVDIALLMLPGLNHSLTKNWSTSPLLINPGGPGGPGTSAAAAFGPRLRSVVGYDQDIIGFDPRGIQYTTPLADCFSFPGPSGETSEDDIHRGVFHRLAWATMGKEVGMVNSSDAALQKLDHRARGVSKLCGEKDKLYGNDSILRHVDTPNVARDMLSIIDAWDAWVEEEKAKKQTVVNCGVQHDKPDNGAVDPLDTKGKLVYWGFSYGSLLGATFAAMFPDRVGRVILDGVVDADHYVAPIWSESIQDTDKVLSMFYRHCVMVASKCSFFRPFDTETTLAARLHEVEARLRNNPIVTVDKYSNAPSVFSYSDLRLLLFSIMYSPVQLFPILSDILNYIYEEDTEFFSRGWGAYLDYKPFCTNDSLGPIERAGEAQLAIMCSDKRYPLNETVHNLNHLFKKLSKHSSFADVWVSVMMGCDGWEIEAEDPPMRWDDHPVHKPKPIKTFFPVLFLSNSADPVTPLAAGVLMARKFVDAGLVEQESGGHCSISTVSQCTIQKVREYFHEGKVPPHPSKLEDAEWTRCSADEWPWQPY